MDNSLILFLAIVFISILQILIYSTEISGLVDKYFKGIIALGMNMLIYFAVIMRPDQKNAVIKGIIIGFTLNICFSLYQYFGNIKGFPFTNLSSFFPQGDYGNELVYFNYVSGFFLEPAHLLKFLCGSFLIWLVYLKTSYLKTIILLITLFVLLISTSSLVVVLLLGTIIFYIILYLKDMDRKVFKYQKLQLDIQKIIGILILWILILSISLFVNWEYLMDSFNFERYVNFIVDGLNLSSNSASSVRITSVTNAFSLIFQYPVGAGFNSSATLMLINFPNSIVGGATFNGLITILLELGIIGLISYIYIFLKSIHQLCGENISKYEIALAVSILTAVIATNLEGAIFSELIWVLLGLSTVSKVK
ncbi:hypothetical protein [Exiguobacterium sp.]|uniref:hypothetical protein n=1 Tax=Exiguobacterium sp. TaxID=44751 RepID=UPI00307FAC62